MVKQSGKTEWQNRVVKQRNRSRETKEKSSSKIKQKREMKHRDHKTQKER